MVEEYKDYPHIYRSVANLAMTEAALGRKKKAVDLRYSFAKGRLKALKAIEKESAKSLRQQAEIVQLKSSVDKLVEMVKKAQSRKKISK